MRELRIFHLQTTPSSPQTRLISLDAFRGAVIAAMILVNNPGGPASYSQLQHSAWDGWTFADWVFPSFLWIAGFSLALSMRSKASSGVARLKIAQHAIRRALLLFGLGLLLNFHPDFALSTLRIPGVLQRIAACSLVAALILLRTGAKGQIAWIAGLLTIYWGLMKFVPVSGFGVGHLDLEGNLAHFVDRLVLGSHNESGQDWDPEGIVSTVPAIATTLLGSIAARIARGGRPLLHRISALALLGVALIAAGFLASPAMPINKNLWSVPFVFWMAGLDCLAFTAFALLLDGWGKQLSARPLVVLGQNALGIYVASELLAATLDAFDAHDWLFENLFAPIASPENASVLYAAAFLGVMYALAYGMHRRGWFWKL